MYLLSFLGDKDKRVNRSLNLMLTSYWLSILQEFFLKLNAHFSRKHKRRLQVADMVSELVQPTNVTPLTLDVSNT